MINDAALDCMLVVAKVILFFIITLTCTNTPPHLLPQPFQPIFLMRRGTRVRQ
jgi:hypothetical protein